MKPWGALSRALVVCACLPTTTLAFESNEHEQIGNLAFDVALRYFLQKYPERSAIYDAANKLTVPGAVGKYERDSKEDRKHLTYGDVIACVDYYLYAASLLVALESTKPFELKDCRGLLGPRFMQASHSNHSHFQNGALKSFSVLHTAAIAAAKKQKDLHHGLLINAIADHYLQDLFAPGHIFTRRDDLSDTIATSIHDRYNANNDVPIIRFKPAFGTLNELIPALCEPPACTLREELKALAPEAKPAEIQKALDDLQAKEALIAPKGDDQLWDKTPDQLKQRLLMVLVGARSIVDVLVAEDDSFSGVEWQEDGHRRPRVANLAFGSYELFGTDAPAALQRPDYNMYRLLGLSYSRETLFSGTRAGRHSFTAEMPLIVGSTTLPWGSMVNHAWIFGLTSYHESSVNGWGPSARVAFVVPQTEFVVGPYVRYLSYPQGDKDVRRWSGGARFDTGFSSYFTFFLALGYDHGTAPDGTFSKGWMGTGGIEVLFPLNRVARTLKAPFTKAE